MKGLLLFLFALPAFCADDKPKLPPLPSTIQAQVDAARTAPPEIFADAIVRMVEGGKIPGVPWQKVLLQDAFAAARQAHEPVRWIALTGLPTDTRASYRAKAGDLQLDALSLEARILKTLLTVDRGAGRQMFQSIPPPRLSVPACEDPLIADASAYYDAAGAVAQASFTPEEKQQSAHVQFLVGVLSGVTTPAELAGFAHSLNSVGLSKSEMEILGGALGAKLDALTANYRSFALKIEELSDGLDFFAARAKGEGVPTAGLGLAFRRFLVAQMKAPRCQEDLSQASNFATSMPVKYLGDIAPLTPEEMKPSQRGSAFEAKNYFEGDRAKELADALNRLRFPPEGRPFSEEERSGSQWRTLFADFLREYQSWTPSGSDVDVLHQRLTVLRWLLELTPRGDDRAKVWQLCVTALQTGAAERQNPAEWDWQARSILDAAGADRGKVAAAYRSAGLQVIE